MNRSDIAYAVGITLGDHIDDYDLDAIVADIIDSHGYVAGIDDIPTTEYWEIVERHDTTRDEYTAEHGYIATIGATSDVVAGDHADVTVGENGTNGNMSTTLVMGPIETTAHIDADMEEMQDAADATLKANGWERTGAWEITDNAMYAPVQRA